MSKPKFKLREVYVLRQIKVDPKKIRKGDVFRFDPLNDADIQVNKHEWFYAEAKPEAPINEGIKVKGNLEFKAKILIPPKIGKTLRFSWPKGKA